MQSLQRPGGTASLALSQPNTPGLLPIPRTLPAGHHPCSMLPSLPVLPALNSSTSWRVIGPGLSGGGSSSSRVRAKALRDDNPFAHLDLYLPFPILGGWVSPDDDQSRSMRVMKSNGDEYEVALLSMDSDDEAGGAEGSLSTLTSSVEELEPLQDPLDKYLHLRNLRTSNPYKYWEMVQEHQSEVLPYVARGPTLSEATRRFHTLACAPMGLCLSLEDSGTIAARLAALPRQDVRHVVVTDGERVMGLGDVGANAMAVVEAKATLYTVAAGVDPATCLPICLDLGTDNWRLREDPEYRGLRRRRASPEEFDAFAAELMQALKQWRPHVVVHWEDFGNANAFRLLDQYRLSHCSFNDEVQGAAATTLAAVLAAVRALDDPPPQKGWGYVYSPPLLLPSHRPQPPPSPAPEDAQGEPVTGRRLAERLANQRILFVGAGQAGTVRAELIAYYLHRRTGMSLLAARRCCYFMDSQGLVCRSRLSQLAPHKRPYAHNVPFRKDLRSAILTVKPTILIGVSAAPNSFDRRSMQLMARLNERPVILPLSTPASKSECTFKQADRWTEGRAIFAGGAPVPPVMSSSGVMTAPCQVSSSYVYPALGRAASLMQWTQVSDDALLVAAEALAGMSSDQDVRAGRLFPSISELPDITTHIISHLATELDAQVQVSWDRPPVSSATKVVQAKEGPRKPAGSSQVNNGVTSKTPQAAGVATKAEPAEGALQPEPNANGHQAPPSVDREGAAAPEGVAAGGPRDEALPKSLEEVRREEVRREVRRSMWTYANLAHPAHAGLTSLPIYR